MQTNSITLRKRRIKTPKPELCSIAGCGRAHGTCGVCNYHYYRWRKMGCPETIEGFKPTPTRTRWTGVEICQIGDCAEKVLCRGLCARHYGAMYAEQQRAELKSKAIALLGGKCSRCGIDYGHPAVYDFHHKDPTQKAKGISNMMQFTEKDLLVELGKCELLCSNCHRILTWVEQRDLMISLIKTRMPIKKSVILGVGGANNVPYHTLYCHKCKRDFRCRKIDPIKCNLCGVMTWRTTKESIHDRYKHRR